MLMNRNVRFVIAGGGAAVLFYTATFSLLRLDVPPFPAVLSAYVVAIVVSYTVQHRWTFGGEHAHARSFPRYVAAQAASALLTSLVARALGGGFDLPPAILSGCTTLFGSALSYVLSRFWVFADVR